MRQQGLGRCVEQASRSQGSTCEAYPHSQPPTHTSTPNLFNRQACLLLPHSNCLAPAPFKQSLTFANTQHRLCHTPTHIMAAGRVRRERGREGGRAGGASARSSQRVPACTCSPCACLPARRTGRALVVPNHASPIMKKTRGRARLMAMDTTWVGGWVVGGWVGGRRGESWGTLRPRRDP